MELPTQFRSKNTGHCKDVASILIALDLSTGEIGYGRRNTACHRVAYVFCHKDPILSPEYLSDH